MVVPLPVELYITTANLKKAFEQNVLDVIVPHPVFDIKDPDCHASNGTALGGLVHRGLLGINGYKTREASHPMDFSK